MIRPEILAPASSFDMARFAVRNGANALYVGLKEFNARRNAENFTLDELKLLCEFCHIRGVSIYLTFNILIKNSEFDYAIEILDGAVSSGIDAVIVQDLGVARLLRERYPTLRLHASTQFSVHNSYGVKQLEEMGFSRVCLARELSFEEIKAIRKSTKMELEVFVHGAHCMSMSGQCYFSALIGGRSGNRGLCGQVCRLPFKNNSQTNSLSLKDLSIIDRLNDLYKEGVGCFKIEGRMKRPEYVKSAVRACRASIDKSPDFDFEYDRLKNVFSRSGFTSGYFDANRTADMFGIRKKEDIATEKLLKELRNSEKEPPLVPITVSYKIIENEKISLTLSDGLNEVTANSNVPEMAVNKEITKKDTEENLCKFGGTPYFVTKVEGILDGGLFVSKSLLNQIRRDATELLNSKRKDFISVKKENYIDPPKIHSLRKEKGIILLFEKAEQIPDSVSADEIYLSLSNSLSAFENLTKLSKNAGVIIPEISFGNTESFKIKLQKLKKIGISKAICNNLYALLLAKEIGFEILAGSGLNIMNDFSAKQAVRLGADKICLSFEMTKSEINDLKTEAETAIIAYGYLPLMLTRACPLSHIGCKNCKDDRAFTDRLGNKFELLCKGEYQKLLNTVPLSVGREAEDFDVDYLILSFTLEDRERVEEIVSSCKNNRNPQNYGFTRGLYNRGVM